MEFIYNRVNLESLNFILYAIKIFFISIYTCYSYTKIINYKNIKVKKLLIYFFSLLLIALLCSMIRYYIDAFSSITCLVLLLGIICSYINKTKLGYSLLITSICLSLNYILFVVSLSITFFISKLIATRNDIINLIIIEFIDFIVLYLIFKIKRLKNGIKFLQKHTKDDYFDIIILNISVAIIFSFILLSNFDLVLTANLAIGFIVFSIITFVTIQKTLTMYYKQKLLIKDLDDTKAELESKKQDIEKLEKENLELSKASHSIAHKQKVLEYRLNELMMQNETASEIEIASKLKKIKNEYASKAHQAELTKTEISEIDDLLNYMQSECIKNNIIFDVQINGSIFHFINNFISKEDLQILLADLIKNAIIAVNHLPAESTNRSILVKLGLIDNCYSVYVYDSGIEFETATLAKLGKEPATTHKDSGGTGMGFMNIFDTLNKYKASLKIKEIGKPSNDNYTKCIIINFDNLQQYDIESYK